MTDPIPGQVPAEIIEDNGSDELSRDEQSEKVIRFMEKLHAPEIFASEETKREYIQNLTFDEFKNLLMATNSMLRDIPVSQRSLDGENVYLKAGVFKIDDEYVPPQHEDKEELLHEMFDDIEKMNQNGRSMQDIALLTSASINAIHLFNDGNGRTSRLLYVLLKDDYTNSEEENGHLTEVLGEDGRDIVDINPGLIAKDIDLYVAKQIGLDPSDPSRPVGFWGKSNDSITKKQIDEIFSKKNDLSDENKSFVKSIVNSDEGKSYAHGFFAFYKFLKDNDTVDKYKKTFYRDDKIFLSRVLTEPIIEDLRDEDAERIKKNYWNIKKMYVREMMNSIVKPDEYFGMDYRGAKVSLRDKLKSRGEKE